MTGTEVVVGRIGKAHGIKGEVSVELRTDEPERRFGEGAVLRTQAPQGGQPHGPDRPAALTVRGTRWHQSRLLVTFEEVRDRNAAEAVRGPCSRSRLTRVRRRRTPRSSTTTSSSACAW
jgi:16S rRNA processing protein RimM